MSLGFNNWFIWMCFVFSCMPEYIEHVGGSLCRRMIDFCVPALRFSISNDLKFDAERDLKDIDAPNIPVHALNKVRPGGIGSKGWETSNCLRYMCIRAENEPSYIWWLCSSVNDHTYLMNATLLSCLIYYCRLSMETQLPRKESCLQLTLLWLERARQEGSTGQELNRS